MEPTIASLWRLRFALLLRFLPIALPFCLLAFYATGWIEREHPVVGPDSSLSIGGRNVTQAEAAARYAPKLASSPSLPSPERAYYSVTAHEGGYYLSYFLVWPEERSPVAVWGFLRSAFRYVYFGGNPEDVECVELFVGMDEGSIDSVRVAETPFRAGKAEAFSGAVCVLSASDEQEAWRHGLRAFAGARRASSPRYSLERLDAETFRKKKFARRKQGRFATRENYGNSVFVLVVCGLMGFYFFRIQIGARKKDHLN